MPKFRNNENGGLEVEDAVDHANYAGIGCCIYCGAIGVKLTSEHVFPYFSGGTMELLDASCLECNRVTSRIDGYCANKVMHGFRHHYGIQSRTKSKPTTVTVQFRTQRGREDREVPFDEAMQVLLMPEYDLPSVLIDGPRNGIVTPRSMNLWTTGDFTERAEKLRRPGDAGWTIVSGGNFELFLRFVAKTALSGAVALIGYDSRKSPLGPVVLGKDKAPRYYIGGDGTTPVGYVKVQTLPPISVERSNLGFQKWAKEDGFGPDLVAAEVRFFANSGMPTYYAIVGEAPDGNIEDLVRDPVSRMTQNG
jgi:hypothetical protein